MPKKVLVCDDEPYILESVSYVVREEGYNVITAEDGGEALRLAKAELPDLILLDIMMPTKNGFEVCRELKSDPATRGTYIVLLTAMGQERDEQEGFQCGADEYMTKPFSPRNLRKRLHELLDTGL
jgi:two-component system, OmpR family, alkaline phosphatase synthesis response regulator PhoP